MGFDLGLGLGCLKIKDLDDDKTQALKDEITAVWNKLYAGSDPIPVRAERATAGTCKQYKLAYYRGQGDTLTRIV